MTASDLADLIKEAFCDVDHQVEAQHGFGRIRSESDDAYAFLAGRGWRDLPVNYVREHYDRVTFLDTDERHAVLPAWLLAAINDEHQLVYHWTITVLLPDGALWNRCTVAQRRAVQEFLKYHIETEDLHTREQELLSLWPD